MEDVPKTIKLKNEQGIDYKTRDKLYKQAIAEVDWSVGKILDTLKESGIDERTFVIFTSDNGPKLGSAKPLRGGKGQHTRRRHACSDGGSLAREHSWRRGQR